VKGEKQEVKMPRLFVVVLMLTLSTAAAPVAAAPAKALKVTVLSTMLVGEARTGIGEWGFAALVEVDGRQVLMDTGARPETVLANARELGVDLSTVTDLVITHNHFDHTAGLVTLRRELSKKNAAALSRVHVPRGIFFPRPGPNGREGNGLLPMKADYEATGGKFIEHAGPAEVVPGLWMAGPIPRVHPERNWSGSGRVQTPEGLVEDIVPEDTSLVVDTADGLVVISGCGHAGMINTLEFARKFVRAAPIAAAIGGYHLFAASDATLAWTAGKLREFGLKNLIGAHCTGIEAVYRLRELTGLERRTAVVGAVGASYTLGKGIDATTLAR
jgi:7,8-dihydropterin-6-yl-methyl-4-(beta-D-ribofuranosyl)aminobenzene 5'-phosphate synthase